jgi:PKD repeat protein
LFVPNEFNLSVDFHAQAASSTSYLWTFGDGTTATGADATHQYAADGTYTACVIAENALGCSDLECVTFTLAQTRCQANYSWENSGLGVAFKDLSDSNTDISGYFWNFGDNSGSTLPSPTHQYAGLGVYEVCLTITADSCSSTFCQMLDLSDPCLSLSADYTTELAGNPLSIQFSDLTSGNPNAWLWNFGDGTTNFTQNPTHDYNVAGAYNVCLIAANESQNCFTEPVCKTVYVGIIATNSPNTSTLRLYPNPVGANDLHIWVEGILDTDFGKNLPVTLTDLHGKTVWSGELLGFERTVLQVHKLLPAGVYGLAIQGVRGQYRGKIFVF